MQKIGMVSLKYQNDTLSTYIAYNTDDLAKTRFEVFDDLSKYDSLNTANCRAAYYQDRKEYRFGDEGLIVKLLKVMSSISVMPGTTTRETDFTGGTIIFYNKKTCKDGSVYTYTTENGLMTEEKYITEDTTIHFYSIDQSSSTVLTPLNLAAYHELGNLSSVSLNDSSDLEYYTEEQLRALYGDRMSHIYEMDIQLSENLEHAFKWLDEFRQTKADLVSVDIESTGLAVDMYGEDCITSVGLAWDETHSMMFPFRQKGCEYNLPIWFFSEIIDALNSLPKTCRVATFNGKMEIESFWKERSAHIKYSDHARDWESDEFGMYRKDVVYENKYVPSDECIKRLETCEPYQRYLRNPDNVNEDMTCRSDVDGFNISMKVDQRRGKGIHTLKSIATRVTGKFWLELDLIFKGKIKFDVLPPNLIKLYAGPDPCNTIAVVRWLEKQLPSSMRYVTALEHQVVYVKSENEYYGMRTDVDLLNREIVQENRKKDILETRFKEIHHTSKNIRSNPVKADIFYNQLHAPVEVRTITGAPSTSKEALNAIIESGELPLDKQRKDVPDIVMWIDSNGFVTSAPKTEEEKKSKTRVTIIKGEKLASNKFPSLLLLQQYNAICKELGALNRIRKKSHNGRVTFYIISSGAESDRQVSDAHQYSDTMKKMILSDSPDHYLISCDYKQVELRVLAFVAGQKDLIELEKDPDIDIHRAILSIINGTPIYLISAKDRKNGKQTNFGVVYGMSEFGLVKRRYGLKYTKEQLLECKKSITDFYLGLPAINKFTNESQRLVLRDKQIATEFGYIREFNQLSDPAISKRQYSKCIKGANNTRIQGFAATLMKMAEVNYFRYIRKMGWDELVDCGGAMLPKVRMMLSIHDEVLISSHKSIPQAEIIKMCKICQEIEIKGAPPFFAAPAFVDNWYLGKDDAYEIPIKFRDEIVDTWDKQGIEILDMNRYLETLNDYRDSVLRSYMDDLIAKYKTKEEVTAHVNHPDLTHVLISGYVKGSDKSRPHVEQIAVAVESYMDGHIIEDIGEAVATANENVNDFIDDNEELGRYISFDDNGEQIVEYVDDETREEFESEPDDEETLPEEVRKAEIGVQDAYAIYTMDTCLIDMTSIYRSPVSETVHRQIEKLAKENPGEYRVAYIAGTRIITTDFKIGYIAPDIDRIMFDAIVTKEE